MNDREAWPHCREAGATGVVNGESCARSHDPVRPPIGRRGGTPLARCARSLTDVAWWSPSLISGYQKALRQPFKPQPWTLLCIRRPRSGYLGPRGSGGGRGERSASFPSHFPTLTPHPTSSQTSSHQASHSPFSQFPSHHAHPDLKVPCPIPVAQGNALQLDHGPGSSPLRLPRPLGDPISSALSSGFSPGLIQDSAEIAMGPSDRR